MSMDCIRVKGLIPVASKVFMKKKIPGVKGISQV